MHCLLYALSVYHRFCVSDQNLQSLKLNERQVLVARHVFVQSLNVVVIAVDKRLGLVSVP